MKTCFRPKVSYVYLIAAAGLLAVGAWQSFRCAHLGMPPIWYLLTFAPGAAFMFAFVLSGEELPKLAHLGLIILSAAVTIVCGGLSLSMQAFHEWTATITDIRQYETIMAKCSHAKLYEPLFEHFPLSVPGDAAMSRFSYQPQFLQGGGHFQLRLKLSPVEIENLSAKFEAQATKFFLGGDSGKHMNEKEGMPTADFHTSDDGRRAFPDDYKIMIFDPLLPESERRPGFYWNHGTSHGVAISKDRSEIVYWTEFW